MKIFDHASVNYKNNWFIGLAINKKQQSVAIYIEAADEVTNTARLYCCFLGIDLRNGNLQVFLNQDAEKCNPSAWDELHKYWVAPAIGTLFLNKINESILQKKPPYWIEEGTLVEMTASNLNQLKWATQLLRDLGLEVHVEASEAVTSTCLLL